MTTRTAEFPHLGSYDPQDVTILLTELPPAALELPTEVRERIMQNGGHYAESLPIEYQPTAEYQALYAALLAELAPRTALLTRVLAARIADHHPAPVLVSLARAGTPVGVLLRRALRRAGIDAPHYTVSIVRDRGLDDVALRHILARHAPDQIVFVDGWTGKGAIRRELALALDAFAAAGGPVVAPTLAVLADPAHVADLAATRTDELVPSACLNSTVSGLLSRTVIRPDLTGPGAFHGVRVYPEFAAVDRSNDFVDTIEAQFAAVEAELPAALTHAQALAPADGRGMDQVRALGRAWDIHDIHRVKPGIGETTRVLLRRVPRLVLAHPQAGERLAHVRMLAAQRGVEVVDADTGAYLCVGLIADRRDA